MGQGGDVPPAGRDVARADGCPLPEQSMAAAAAGRLRPAGSVQEPARAADVGAGHRAAAGRRRGAGGIMNRAIVDRVADAVPYEGYILYPYRPSVKNRQRWTFGGLYPEVYCTAQGGTDAWSSQTECLVGGSPDTVLEATVRFLHLTARVVGECVAPLGEWPD